MVKYKKLVSGSFWFIMAVHLVVFTAIGFLSTKGWRLLILFLLILGALVGFGWLLRLYSKRHPEKQALARFLSTFFH
jgi:Flp pilus assembly protein TadB